jgi:acetyl esterase/lipase
LKEAQGQDLAPAFLTVPDVLGLPAGPADARVAYGSDPAQYGELRLPPGPGPHPVVVVVHGGCWLGEYDLATTSALADALRHAGVATWHLEYRRIDMPGGGWPGTFHDIADGVDALRFLAVPHGLDLGRVVVTGHSAGGHLALWAASRHKVPAVSDIFSANPLRPCGAVVLAGPCDLRRFVDLQESSCGGPVVTRLLGGWPDEVPDRYQAASPIELLPIGIPQAIITGAHDPTVPPGLGAAYAGAARAAGDEVGHLVVPAAAHFEVIAPGSVAWPVVKREVRRLARL